MWTDENKIVLFGGTGFRQYVRRPPNTANEVQCKRMTFKYGGAKVLSIAFHTTVLVQYTK